MRGSQKRRMCVAMPVTAAWLIGFLLGINLISVGAAIAWLAWQIRQA